MLSKVLFIDQYLPRDVDRVILFDADQLFTKKFNLSELYNLDIGDNVWALPKHEGDLESKWWENYL